MQKRIHPLPAQLDCSLAMKSEVAGCPCKEHDPHGVQATFMQKQKVTVQEEVDNRSLYIKNVHADIEVRKIEEHFHPVLSPAQGTINRITIVKNARRPARSFGYIELDSVLSRDRCLELDNTDLDGQVIQLRPKRTNKPGYLREEIEEHGDSEKTGPDFSVDKNESKTNLNNKHQVLFHISASLERDRL